MLGDFSLGAAVKAGGSVMYLLIVCSVLSIAVIFDRLFCYYTRSRFSRTDFMQAIRSELAKGDIKKALAICQDIAAPFAAVVAAALKASHLDEKEICSAMEREIVIETQKLEKRTAIVGTIGSTAVYIGLLGTVWGIIKAFKDISSAGSGGINVVTSGISEALVCTAAGLIVAIPAVAAYNYFVNRINEFVADMELCESEITGLIKRAGKG